MKNTIFMVLTLVNGHFTLVKHFTEYFCICSPLVKSLPKT